VSTVTCPGCGNETPAGFPRCAHCGAELTAQTPAREERKVVTVLFCDLVGFTARAEALDPEDVEAILGPYHAHVRGELERFGGTVEKFIGDAVMAVFGAPAAHEDDPERAVRAALAIRDWAREQEALELRIGITTGEALVALGARPEHGEAMVKGDVVNTAARLQAAAPTNAVLVAETTYHATRQRIDYRELEPVDAKGKTDPVRVWEALQGRALVTVEREARAPLVGRDRELSLLVDALKRARSEREPQLVTLVGVPGIGKSRLVYELFRSIEQATEVVYWRRGRSLSYGEGVTFWALGEMVKAQAGILETDDAGRAAEKLRAAVGTLVGERDSAWVERHLRPLVGLSADGDARGDPREEAFAAWRRFFERLAEERPLVLVFEDLHWADDVLLDFVDELVDWASGVPLLVLGTARPELLSRRPAWGGGKPNAVTISLSPLSDTDTARLLAGLLGRPVVDAETQATLLAHAGGNPLFAEEFVRLVQERGGDLAVPESVQGIIAARLDALPADDKSLLQDAAVLGRTFWDGGVAAIGERDPRVLDRALHGLERREFVRRERRSSVEDETELIFRHALLREVAYNQIPRPSRADKHRRAAEWIESLSPDRSEDRAEMLAHHYAAALEFAEASGQPTEQLRMRAYAALREAGDRAFGLSAFPAAARFYERTLELAPPDDASRLRMLHRRARALQLAGDERAGTALEEARDALLAAGDVDGAAELETFLAEVAWYAGRAEEVAERIERARELVVDSGVSPGHARVLAQVARHRMLAGSWTAAIEPAREAVALAERLELADVQASALNSLGMSRWQLGDEEGRGDVERAVETAVKANSYEASRAYYNLAGVILDDGDIEHATALYEQAVGVAERFGNAAMREQARAMLGPMLFISGRWDEARQLIDELLERYAASGGHYLEGGFVSGRAMLRAARGEASGAAADAERAMALARVANDPQAVVPVFGRALRAYVTLGRIQESTRIADGVIEAWGSRTSGYFGDFAWIAEAIGRVAEIRALIEAAPRRTQFTEAELAILAGDHLSAAEVFERAGWRSDEAEARLRAAEQLVAGGRRAEADVQLQAALAFFRSVGATFYVRRGEKLLAASA
jgi:class 3 adenylate cyclase/tetratricopeptide (TPR) repeat protein